MIARRTLLSGAFSAWAQDATFKTDVKVVSLLATVQDRDGRVVKDLSQEDFLLVEDGRPQTIRYFSRESDLPLTLGLLVDTSRSQIPVIVRELDASDTFLSTVLREKIDQAFIVSFDEKVKILQGLTSSRQSLSAALLNAKIPARTATLIYEAVRLSADTVMRKQPGRKALILLTDGNAFRDKTTIGTAIEFAQRADTMIFGIRYSGDRTPPVPAMAIRQATAAEHGKQVLLRMTSETGGLEFEVTREKPVEQAFADLQDLLRNQYSIGYTPDPPGERGTYRKVKLSVKRPDLTVRTRDGYYPE